MKNIWSDSGLKKMNSLMVEPSCEKDFAELLFATRLIGSDPDLALHGGGNTSIKSTITTLAGESRNALFVKASGVDMANIEQKHFVALDADRLANLRVLKDLTDQQMVDEFHTSLVKASSLRPSIETLMHAFLPARVILHSHPSAILALTNRTDGLKITKEACPGVVVIPYIKVGFQLAVKVALAVKDNPGCKSLIIMNHGLVTWASSAKEAYDNMISIVSGAESFLDKRKNKPVIGASIDIEKAMTYYEKLAPVIRGILAPVYPDEEGLGARVVLKPLIEKDILSIISSAQAQKILISQPLTPDYLIRRRRLPLWVEANNPDDAGEFKDRLTKAIDDYILEYRNFITRFTNDPINADAQKQLPRAIIIPGIGVVCAGDEEHDAVIVRDIMRQEILTKAKIVETDGTYKGIEDDHLFDMEFRDLQRAKIAATNYSNLKCTIVLVTGAAGAIGSGICRALAKAGCHVALTDLAGPALDATTMELSSVYGDKIIGVALDVTDPLSVASGFNRVVREWGGIDLVIVNAGIAHVALLADLPLEAFRKLEKVNVEGTLLLLAEAGRLFKRQNTGGDIVLISTKNVFAPGASFGAYSATKAASHQLARIASLEMASMGVRVNMVAPDAVFSDGAKKSGLWATVGPDRMKARGLDEKGLEQYYQSRNLLKARVTADHVANAVLFFATHQTPTTGATIPVDGGLPDATPR